MSTFKDLDVSVSLNGYDNYEIERIISEFENHIKERTQYHMGYPYNLHYDYGCLSALHNYSINNLGDPFKESNYGVHSRAFEIAVLDWFADLWEIARADYWGYITNCGTEGNLQGILVGRENYPNGILYASQDSHYSVFKAASMYRMDYKVVRSTENGKIDYEDLRKSISENINKPAIINLNIGTTMKGAVDNIDRVLEILGELEKKDYFIHCDGALFGMMLPFVLDVPQLTFKKGIHSISVSGHKFVGSPVPCGVFVTRKEHVIPLSKSIEYINSNDITIMGSRNGHTPLYMWYTLCKKGLEGLKHETQYCLDLAKYLYEQLKDKGIACMLNKMSSTVVFQKPAEAVVKKWQLACQGDWAHVVIMPNINKEQVHELLQEILNK